MKFLFDILQHILSAKKLAFIRLIKVELKLFVGQISLQDSPRLGPMELQLLSVIGTKKPVLPQPFDADQEVNELASLPDPGDGSRPENYTSPRNWPITNNMLQTLAIQ